jgi:tetratricopeptide (TPR) repeat protein
MDRTLEISPYLALAWFNKAVLHLKKWEVAEFLQATHKVLEYGNPEEEYVRHAKEQLNQLKASLASEGINLDDYILAGQLFDQACNLMEQEKYEEALAGFRRVLAINRESQQSYGNMGLCYAKLGQRSKALEMFDQALAVEPDYEVAIINRLMIERMQEGEKIGPVRSVCYGAEYMIENNSLIVEIAGELEQEYGVRAERHL